MNQASKLIISLLVLLSIWEFVIPPPFLLKIVVVFLFPFLLVKYPFHNKHALIIFISLIIWYVYGWISLGWSVGGSERITSFKVNYFITFCFIICIISAFKTKKLFEFALKLLFYNGLIILLFAFAEFVLHRYFFYQDTDIFYADAGWYIPLVNQKGPNEFVAELVALYIFGLIYLTKKNFKPILRYTFILSYGITIFITDSRSGLLAFIAVSTVFFTLNKQYKVVKVLLVAGLALFLVVIGLNFASVGASIETEPRYLIWLNYLDKFAASGYRGIGWASIGEDNTGAYHKMVEGNIHNYFLEVLVEVGFIGLICFLYLYGYVLTKSYSLYKKSHKMNTDFLYLFLFAIGFALTSIGPSSMRQLNDMWLFLGISIAYCIMNEKDNKLVNRRKKYS